MTSSINSTRIASSFIKVHLKKNNSESTQISDTKKTATACLPQIEFGTVNFDLKDRKLIYVGFHNQNIASGEGCYTLITKDKIELKYQGTFSGFDAIPGQGIFSIYDPLVSDNCCLFSLQVLVHQTITSLFNNTLKALRSNN